MCACAQCPYASKVTNHQRDGVASVSGNGGSERNYGSNSYPKTLSNPAEVPAAAIARFKAEGVVGRFQHDHPNSDWEQPGIFFREVLSAQERRNLVDNIVSSLSGAKPHTQARMIDVFTRVDKDYGRMVSEALKKVSSL